MRSLFNRGRPDISRYVMPLRSCHRFFGKNSLFALKKHVMGPFQGVTSTLFDPISDTCRGPTPLLFSYVVQQKIAEGVKGLVPEGFGNREFSSLAGSTSARYMPRRRIRSDIRHITRAARPMKLLTDKVIAHTEEDRRKAGRPTSAQIDKAVDVLVDIYKRYYSLLNASTLDTCRAAADVDVSGDLKKIWPE